MYTYILKTFPSETDSKYIGFVGLTLTIQCELRIRRQTDTLFPLYSIDTSRKPAHVKLLSRPFAIKKNLVCFM